MFQFADPINVTVSGYTMDIAPVLNALIRFVSAILDAYLPDDLKETANDLGNLAK